MGSFAEDFRAVFPQYPEEFYGTLQPANEIELAYVEFVHLPSLARHDSIELALSRTPALIRNLQESKLDFLSRIAADALVAIADMVITTGAEVRSRTRQIVNLLDLVGESDPLLNPLINAHAAVIHARADDRLLASHRLRRSTSQRGDESAEGSVFPADPVSFELLDHADRLLNRNSASLIPDTDWAMETDRMVRAAWDFMLGLTSSPRQSAPSPRQIRMKSSRSWST
jgi:hypothetical protein